MVGSLRFAVTGLVLGGVWLTAVTSRAAEEPPSAPAVDPENQDAQSPESESLVPLQFGEDPPAPFVPRHPRTADDRRRLDALRDYVAARALEDRRQWNAAIERLEAALEKDPDSVAILRRLTRLNFARGRTENAVDYGRRVLEADPEDITTLGQLIAYYSDRENDPAAAEALLNEVLAHPDLDKDSPGFLFAQFALGQLYIGPMPDPNRAADAFEAVLEALEGPAADRLSPLVQQLIFRPNEATTYQSFGAVFLEAGQLDLAVKALQRSLDLAPNHPRTPMLLSLALVENQQPDEALEILERYLRRQPQGREPYDLLARILTELDREDEILPRLEEAAEADAQNAPLQYLLAERYREAGQVEKANELYRRLLETQPDPQGFGALSASLLNEKKTEELLKLIDRAVSQPGGLDAVRPQVEAVATDPEYAQDVLETGLKLLAEDPPGLGRSTTTVLTYLAERTQNTEALLELRRLRVQQEPNPQAYLDLFRALYFELRQYEEAAGVLDELLEKFPTERNARLLNMLGQTRLLADQNEQALEALQAASELEPDNPDTIVLSGYALGRLGRHEEAIAQVRDALEDDPDHPELNRSLGQLLAQSGQHDEAIAHFEDLLERFPNDDDMVMLARSNLSMIYVDMGEYAKGEAELEILYEKHPDDPGVNNDLGYLYADHGKNLEQAEVMIRKALEDDPDRAAYLDSLGWVLFKQGRVEEALEPLERAVEQPGGNDPTILDHLGDVYFELRRYDQAREAWEKAETQAQRTDPPDKRLPEIRKKLDALKDLTPESRTAAGDKP